jgi:hypothetical protein
MKPTNARLGFTSCFIAANEKPDFFKKVGFLTPLHFWLRLSTALK